MTAQVVGAEGQTIIHTQLHKHICLGRVHNHRILLHKQEQNSDMNIFCISFFLYTQNEPLFSYFSVWIIIQVKVIQTWQYWLALCFGYSAEIIFLISQESSIAVKTQMTQNI